jgi:hypothetical protein
MHSCDTATLACGYSYHSPPFEAASGNCLPLEKLFRFPRPDTLRVPPWKTNATPLIPGCVILLPVFCFYALHCNVYTHLVPAVDSARNSYTSNIGTRYRAPVPGRTLRIWASRPRRPADCRSLASRSEDSANARRRVAPRDKWGDTRAACTQLASVSQPNTLRPGSDLARYRRHTARAVASDHARAYAASAFREIGGRCTRYTHPRDADQRTCACPTCFFGTCARSCTCC